MMRMANSTVKQAAFNDLKLLKSVVASKNQFYPRGWAHYDLAYPGTMKLSPPAHVLSSLRRDYSEMQIMIFGMLPMFDEIMEKIQILEKEINSIT